METDVNSSLKWTNWFRNECQIELEADPSEAAEALTMVQNVFYSRSKYITKNFDVEFDVDCIRRQTWRGIRIQVYDFEINAELDVKVDIHFDFEFDVEFHTGLGAYSCISK